MQRSCTVTWSWSALASILLFTCGLRADVTEIPGADDRSIPTERQVNEQKLAHDRRTIVDAYKQVGVRDPKWDEPAVAFLDACCVALSNDDSHVVNRTFPDPDAAERVKLGRRAMDAGCADPLVLDLFAAALREGGHAKEAATVAARAGPEIIKSAYPTHRKLAAAQRWLVSLDPKAEPAKLDEVEQLCRKLLVQMLTDGTFKADERRQARRHVGLLHTGKLAVREQIMNDVEAAKGVDPWVLHVALGELELDRAWAARGNRSADHVTREGWRLFFGHMGAARDHFARAWAIDPSLPHPAASMIRVAYGAGEQLGEDPEEWFRRAVGAQFDFTPAYVNYLHALRPRWNGSYEQMYAFGEACLVTGRYDTRVPSFFVEVLVELIEETGGRLDLTELPGAWAQLAQCFDGYLDAHDQQRVRDFYLNQKATFGWRFARWAEAKAAMDQMSWPLKPWPATILRADCEDVAHEINAMAGEKADVLASIFTDAARGRDLQPAIDGYQKLLESLPEDHAARPFIANTIAEMTFTTKLLGGDWVDVTPTKDLCDWKVLAGKWEIDAKGDLIGTCDGGLMLLYRPRLPNGYQVRCDVEVIAPAPRPQDTRVGIVPVWGVANRERFAHVSFKEERFKWGRDTDILEGIDMRPTNKLAFAAAIDPDRWLVDVNGRRVIDKNPGADAPADTERRFGLGGVPRASWAPKGGTFRFTNIQVRLVGAGQR